MASSPSHGTQTKIQKNFLGDLLKIVPSTLWSKREDITPQPNVVLDFEVDGTILSGSVKHSAPELWGILKVSHQGRPFLSIAKDF